MEFFAQKSGKVIQNCVVVLRSTLAEGGNMLKFSFTYPGKSEHHSHCKLQTDCLTRLIKICKKDMQTLSDTQWMCKHISSMLFLVLLWTTAAFPYVTACKRTQTYKNTPLSDRNISLWCFALSADQLTCKKCSCGLMAASSQRENDVNIKRQSK